MQTLNSHSICQNSTNDLVTFIELTQMLTLQPILDVKLLPLCCWFIETQSSDQRIFLDRMRNLKGILFCNEHFSGRGILCLFVLSDSKQPYYVIIYSSWKSNHVDEVLM